MRLLLLMPFVSSAMGQAKWSHLHVRMKVSQLDARSLRGIGVSVCTGSMLSKDGDTIEW